MPDKHRVYQPSALNHVRPYIVRVTFGHVRAVFAPGWSHLLKMNRKARARARRRTS